MRDERLTMMTSLNDNQLGKFGTAAITEFLRKTNKVKSVKYSVTPHRGPNVAFAASVTISCAMEVLKSW